MVAAQVISADRADSVLLTCRRQVLFERLQQSAAMMNMAAPDVDQFAAAVLPLVADAHLLTLQDEVEASVFAYRR